MKTLRMYWCLSPNFGDAMAPYFATKKDFSPVFIPESERGKVLLSGSILNHALPGDAAWGVGLAYEHDPIQNGIDIRAARGPITAKRLVRMGYPEMPIGDSGLAVAFLYNPQVYEHKASVAVVPHYVDYARALKHFEGRPGVRVVNVLDPVEKVVDNIFNAERVLSSSLHGLVTAAAYGLPFAWLRGSSAIGGDGYKYRDFLLSARCQVYSVTESSIFHSEVYQKANLISSPTEIWMASPLHDNDLTARFA